MAEAWTELGAIDPRALVEARLQAHHAVQWLARAARANLARRPQDRHMNLGWHRGLGALVTHDLVSFDAKRMRFGLRIAPPTLLALRDGWKPPDAFALDGKDDVTAGAWVDKQAAALGTRAPSSALLPYAIPDHPVAARGRYGYAAHAAEFAELARWFAAADNLLQEVRNNVASTGAELSPVRCWPHHFDIATSLSLDAGEAETARSIGIGMSPGDEHYAEPYFYVSPWPYPTADRLPDLPASGHWHSQGFVAAILTGEALLASPDRRAAAGEFIAGAMTAARRLLSAK